MVAKRVKQDGGSAKEEESARGSNGEADAGAEAAPATDGEAQAQSKTGFFSGEKFADLPLSEGMHAALQKLGFTMTTKIQASESTFTVGMSISKQLVPFHDFSSTSMGSVARSCSRRAWVLSLPLKTCVESSRVPRFQGCVL